MNKLGTHIIKFDNSPSQKKIEFTNYLKEFVDVGKELSVRLQSVTKHKRLSLKAKDVLDEVMNDSIKTDKVLGAYIPLKNLGILFEQELKIDFVHFLKTYSSEMPLIIDWPGEINGSNIYFLSEDKGFKLDLKNFTYTIHEV